MGKREYQQNTSQNSSNSSPPNKMAAFGQGPGLTDGGAPPPDLSTFLDQLDGAHEQTSTILALTESPELKLVLQQLLNITKSAAQLLRREASSPREWVEEERRLHSIVISGLPESLSASATTRAEEDRRHVMEMLDLAEVEALPVVYRMGRRDKPPSLAGSNRAAIPHARLLKVEMPTKKMAREFLVNRGKFLSNSAYKSVFIRPSLTPAQLAKRKDLYNRRYDLNKAPGNADDPFVVYGPPGEEKLMKKSEIKKR
jgi:hypothetical protein